VNRLQKNTAGRSTEVVRLKVQKMTKYLTSLMYFMGWNKQSPAMGHGLEQAITSNGVCSFMHYLW
jgi:hypothetical protein